LRNTSKELNQRIVSDLQKHPDGIDDDQLSTVLGLGGRQQADLQLRELEKQGLVIRRRVNRRILNFWAGAVITSRIASPTNTPEAQKVRPKTRN
jgi:predicted transcriptional regulator